MDKPGSNRTVKIFVLMPFAPRFDNLYDYVLRAMGDRLGMSVIRADDLPFDNRQIYDQIIATIDSADAIVADLSDRNRNVYYEVGYAHARGKAVIPISADALPFDVAGFRTIIYQRERLKDLERSLESALKDVLTHRQEGRSEVHPEVLKYSAAVRGFAFGRAERVGWKRPDLYFTQYEIIERLQVPQNLAFLVLDSLRSGGVLACVNWKGEAVWMAAQ